MNFLQIDEQITRIIYNLFNNNPIIKDVPYYLGLIPYEIYIIPGMYIAILQVIWFSSFNPIQFHLFPHFFTYCLFQLLKGSIVRKRPGCRFKNLSNHIDASHCNKKNRLMSFPSGHTGVAFALAGALMAEMLFSKNPKFFDMEIKNTKTQKIIAGSGIFVAIMISLHRISKGYHFFGDVIFGGTIGLSLGLISWLVLNTAKDKLNDLCEKPKNENDDECKPETENTIRFLFKNKIIVTLEIIIKVVLTIIVLFLLHKFLTKDLWKLASIKH